MPLFWFVTLKINAYFFDEVQTLFEKGIRSYINKEKSCHESNVRVSNGNFYKSITCELLRHKHSTHPTKGREYCQNLYNRIKKDRFNGDIRQTDLFFFKMLGIIGLAKAMRYSD